jgi:cell division protein DivIC
MSAKGGKKKMNLGTISIVIIVLAFLVVMSIQIMKLKEKDDLLAERETMLQQQLADEVERAEELEDLDLYTKSMEYIKEMANKLGLVFENEIIFKESDE